MGLSSWTLVHRWAACKRLAPCAHLSGIFATADVRDMQALVVGAAELVAPCRVCVPLCLAVSVMQGSCDLYKLLENVN